MAGRESLGGEPSEPEEEGVRAQPLRGKKRGSCVSSYIAGPGRASGLFANRLSGQTPRRGPRCSDALLRLTSSAQDAPSDTLPTHTSSANLGVYDDGSPGRERAPNARRLAPEIQERTDGFGPAVPLIPPLPPSVLHKTLVFVGACCDRRPVDRVVVDVAVGFESPSGKVQRGLHTYTFVNRSSHGEREAGRPAKVSHGRLRPLVS